MLSWSREDVSNCVKGEQPLILLTQLFMKEEFDFEVSRTSNRVLLARMVLSHWKVSL